MNHSKALGPDELHPRDLKELATELGPVFVHLIQQSIDTGEIPKAIDSCKYVPFSRSVTGHLRTIIARLTCKLLEHIVHVCSNIMAHLDEYKLLSDRHHAFRKEHICESQLTTVRSDHAKILDKLTHSYWILKKHLTNPS